MSSRHSSTDSVLNLSSRQLATIEQRLAFGSMAQRFSRKYTTYMDGPGWTHRKRRYFETHERKCRACGITHGIQLHHLTYERLGHEHDWDLMPLCKKHHDRV